MGANDLILDRYKPLGKAGSGGFGTVQVAWDPRIQRKVAIKTIELTELDAYRAGLPGADAIGSASGDGEGLPWDEYPEGVYDGDIYDDGAPDDYSANDEFNGYLDDADDGWGDGQNPAMVRALSHLPGLDEARTAAMLSDPRIVTVYDFEIRGRTAYLIMEYVEGITLTQLLHDYDGQLTLDMVASVFESVAGALTAAHEAGVLHLDIKPDNILLNPQGQVKVTDFGLATLADASGEGKTGGGTIGYMPPEQMRREYLDARCDEWSLASVTYEMLSGTNPFVVASLDEAEAAINDAELVLPSLCWEGLDEEIDDVMFTALDPDRDERYDSVAEFADELLPYLGDEDEGRSQLSALVHDALGIVDVQDEEEDDEEEALSNVRRSVRRTSSPLRERISKHLLGLAARAFAAIGSAAVVIEAVINVPALYNLTPNFGGLVLVVALAAAALGAVFPHVGALVAFIVLAAALIAGGSPIAGVVLIIASGLWWWFAGRGGKAAANSVLSLPLAGAIGGNVFAPLIAGVSLAPLRALGTAALCVVVALVFGAMGTNNLIWWNAYTYWRFSQVEVDPAFIAMLTQPATWCIAASWIAGAGVGGLISQRGTRTSLLIGLALSVVIMVAGDLGAVWLDAGHMALVPAARLVAPLVVSTIVIVAVIMWLRPDPEPEDDEPID
ncbi:MAG: serine/threonine protein kinase [Eggerthellaceae bacterium]|nr:serine/threonine protein kinase [Eggerthellaceae bacterium]